MKRFFLALLAGVLLAGCATTPRINWPARIGNYTYDQAILDFGPPDKSAKLSDGGIVAEWLTERGQRIIAPQPYFGSPGYYFGPFAPNYSEMDFPPRFLRLTFGADGKLLAEKQFSK
ncbi:MAG TPA: hypothetical protein VIK59_11560 [Verrucomicrobiae bacterium]